MTLTYCRRPGWHGAAFILAVVVWLNGCAGAPQTEGLLAEQPDHLPAAQELTNVPFYPQEAYQCGPASLAMLLNHQQIAVTPQQLTPKLFIPEKKGSLQIELLSNTRQYGLIPYQLQPALEDVFKEVDAGNPVLVFQNLALKWYPQWHYAVLVGYDLKNQNVILRSGRDKRRVTDMSVFERTWARADRWAMLALQPGQLPVTVDYWPYLQAVASMEKVKKHQAALKGYQAGLKQWPNDIRLRMGLSNSQYALGQLGAAAATLREVVSIDPDYAPAYNNLAQINLEQGNLEQAEQYAARAVHLGGDHAQTYQKTLEEIRARRSLRK